MSIKCFVCMSVCSSQSVYMLSNEGQCQSSVLLQSYSVVL